MGKKPGPRIKRFNNKIINYLYKKKHNNNLHIGQLLNTIKKKKENSTKYFTLLNNKLSEFDIRYNNIQHQKGDSECGVYSMNFIIRLAKGESFDDIIKNITNDNEMNQCRKVYFR